MKSCHSQRSRRIEGAGIRVGCADSVAIVRCTVNTARIVEALVLFGENLDIARIFDVLVLLGKKLVQEFELSFPFHGVIHDRLTDERVLEDVLWQDPAMHFHCLPLCEDVDLVCISQSSSSHTTMHHAGMTILHKFREEFGWAVAHQGR